MSESTPTERNALERAIDRVESVFGRPGKEAIAVFLASLPSDATITWHDSHWAPAELVAMQLHAELADD